MGDAYGELIDRLRRIHAIGRAAGLLRWDQETYMPPGGTEARAGELSTLATVRHRLMTDDRTGQLLEAARAEAQTEAERAVLREARWRYERETRVPEALVERLSEVTSRAHSAWVKAKRDADFERFRPLFEEIVELRVRYAEAIDPDEDPYAVLFADHEPWIEWPRARAIIEELRAQLVPLVDRAPTPSAEHVLEGSFPLAAQRELMHDLLETLGYDFHHGRIDEAEHPFSTGNAYDARITTHLHEDDLLSGLTSTVHEFGHALYTQGLPREHLGTPLGESRNLVVHEANSRLWENHVARSLPFWELLAPKLAERFPNRGELAPEDCWQAANRVEPGLIRVDADELSYHLHIALRVEIEEQLITGELAVEDAPERWNDRMDTLLGIRPEDDAEGILQDVHWSHGSIGYFPTYSLGSMLAAQVYRSIEDAVGPLDPAIRAGETEPIRTWLREEIHRHGRLYTTDDLIEQATGAPLSAQPFIDYAQDKYGRLWDR